jgi:hypothetical protein
MIRKQSFYNNEILDKIESRISNIEILQTSLLQNNKKLIELESQLDLISFKLDNIIENLLVDSNVNIIKENEE